jgi:hypothetical protein
MSRRALRWVVVATLVGGFVLMIGFDTTVTRIAGVACLLGFVVSGVFYVADPGFVAEDG